jgi:glycosyltransferase involved in cell wall biosynthesis
VKVLMVAPTPFFSDRGCHVRILEECRALTALGHDVEVATYHHGSTPHGARVFRTPRVPWYRKQEAGPSWHKPYVDVMLAALVLLRARRFRPDVIHAHLHEGIAVALPAARLLRVPLVADIQGSFTDELWSHGFPQRPALLGRLLLWFERTLLGRPRVIVTSSARMAVELQAMGATRPVLAAADGVDIDDFRPDAPALAAPRAVPGPVIVFLGLLTDYQGVSQLLRCVPTVLAHTPTAQFLVMGYPNVEHYRGMAMDLGIADSVTFTGRVPYDAAPRFLARGNVAVSPKLSKTESNGKLLNYMSMALPTVAFDTPINRELLGPEGVYVDYGDAEALAKGILRLLDDPQDARRRGEALRRRAEEQFSWRHTADVLVESYCRSFET